MSGEKLKKTLIGIFWSLLDLLPHPIGSEWLEQFTANRKCFNIFFFFFFYNLLFSKYVNSEEALFFLTDHSIASRLYLLGNLLHAV